MRSNQLSVSTIVFALWLCLLTALVFYRTTNYASPAGEEILITAEAPAETEMEKLIFKTIANKPELLQQAFLAGQKRQEMEKAARAKEALKSHKKELFNNSNLPSAGNPKGDVTVVDFFDYRCGYCKKMSKSIEEVMAKDKNVRFVFVEFPIFGEGSALYAKAALAAHKQGKYWSYHQKLMEATGNLDKNDLVKMAGDLGLDKDQFTKDMEDAATEAALKANQELGAKLGVQATPMFIIGDDIHPGYVPGDVLAKMVAEER